MSLNKTTHPSSSRTTHVVYLSLTSDLCGCRDTTLLCIKFIQVWNCHWQSIRSARVSSLCWLNLHTHGRVTPSFWDRVDGWRDMSWIHIINSRENRTCRGRWRKQTLRKGSTAGCDRSDRRQLNQGHSWFWISYEFVCPWPPVHLSTMTDIYSVVAFKRWVPKVANQQSAFTVVEFSVTEGYAIGVLGVSGEEQAGWRYKSHVSGPSYCAQILQLHIHSGMFVSYNRQKWFVVYCTCVVGILTES